MRPWYWVLLLIGANLGIWAIEEAFEFKETMTIEALFVSACGLVYAGEMWPAWRKRWNQRRRT